MTRLLRAAALLLPAMLAGAGTLAAQTVPSPYQYLTKKQSVEITAGYLFTDPTVHVNDTLTAAFGPQSAPLVSMAYSLRVSEAVSLRAEVGYAPSKRSVYRADVTSDTTTVSPVRTSTKVDIPLYVADAGLRLNLTGARTWHGMAPWAGAGAGLVGWIKGTSADEASVPVTERFQFGPAFALALRAGNDWYPTQRLSVGVHASDYLWKVKVPRGFQSGSKAVTSEWTHNFGVTAGAAVHF
jgi:hypothetical protein